MYNLYTYEKKILENEKKQSEDLLKKELEKKRKQEITQLSKKYEDRMKDFIFSMCDKPVILHKDSIKEEKNNTFSKKNFKFGEFKTDKQRLEIMESYKNKLKIYEDKRKNIEKKRNILKIKNHRNLILIQPEMRFNSRTKLEKIIEKIQKDDITNVDIFKSSLLEHIKKLKFNGVRKIKEFYYLIDKEDLKDDDIKKFIDKINDIEQCDANNQYNLKNYIEWKYHQNITNNNNSVKKEKRKKSTNDSILQNMGNEDNKIKSKNEYEILVKDDFKTHFKGASQYVMNLIDDKNQYYNKIDIKNQKFRATSAIPFYYKENKLSNYNSKLSRNVNNAKYLKKNESYKNERPISMRILNNEENNKFKKYLKDDSIKKLGIKYQIKKRKMDEIINKEINNSILKKFFNDLNKKQYNKIINEPYFLEKNSILLQKRTKTVEPDIENKLAYLKRLIKFETEEKNQKTIFKQRNKNFRKNIRKDNDDNEVIIDGKKFKENDIKNIADAIFTKCGYYHKKII